MLQLGDTQNRKFKQSNFIEEPEECGRLLLHEISRPKIVSLGDSQILKHFFLIQMLLKLLMGFEN